MYGSDSPVAGNEVRSYARSISCSCSQVQSSHLDKRGDCTNSGSAAPRRAGFTWLISQLRGSARSRGGVVWSVTLKW